MVPACAKFQEVSDPCEGADIDIPIPGLIRVCVFLFPEEMAVATR